MAVFSPENHNDLVDQVRKLADEKITNFLKESGHPYWSAPATIDFLRAMMPCQVNEHNQFFKLFVRHDKAANRMSLTLALRHKEVLAACRDGGWTYDRNEMWAGNVTISE